MVPIFSASTFLFFYKSGYNFAEIVVFCLYTISMYFLLVAIINFGKLIVPDLETRFIEIPVVLIYNAITFKNFFSKGNRWLTILKGTICGLIAFLTVASLQDYFVDNF